MGTVFTPEHRSLDQIFAADTTYRIPAYQRPYSWQAIGKSDRDGQVNQMWDDLWSFFEENPQNNREYFLGSMVIVEDKGALRTFEVIDGQQRLTTLLLLFAAMRCFLQSVERAAPAGGGADVKRWLDRTSRKLEDFVYNEQGPSLLSELKLKVERSVGGNFNEAFRRAAAGEGEAQVAGLADKHREAAQRYFKNRDYFEARLRECFLPPPGARGGEPVDLHRLDQFIAFLRTRVAIVVIKTSEFGTAYRIFEILNNRGLPLTNLDLLRNFVIERLAAAKVPDPDARWERLESHYTFKEDFIGRWTESARAAQPKASSFNEAQELYEREFRDDAAGTKIENFYRDLERNLFWYNLVIEAEQRVEDLAARNAVAFIGLLGNERYSTNLLLALFRARRYEGRADAEVVDFLRAYRAHALYVSLLGRFASALAYEAIKELNKGEVARARALFALADGEKRALGEYFDGRLNNEEGRRLLAAYAWYREEQDGPDVVSQHLFYEKSTLEHVMPQKPAEGSNWLSDFSKDFRAQFTYRIGNMTLLTQQKNSLNKNYDFSKKRLVYAQSRLPMTVKLGEQAHLTRAYLEARQQEIVSALRAVFVELR
jgi:hypothetical protein